MPEDGFVTPPPRRFPSFGDAILAERLVAQHLRRAGCELAQDVPLPSGSTADFAVARDGLLFHAHVKSLADGADDDRPAMASSRGAAPRAARLGPIPRVLRELGEIPRAIQVAVRWRPGAGCAAFRRMVREVSPFLRAARVSEERVARDRDGAEIGRVRVVGPAPPGSRLQLVDERRVARRERQAVRAQRLLRKALAQFMPRSANLIVLVGRDPDQEHAVELALRGSIIEAWDRYPPRGERVAHGRADDGFWSRGRASASHAVAWILASSSGRPTRRRLWLRDGTRPAAPLRELLHELFDDRRPAP